MAEVELTKEMKQALKEAAEEAIRKTEEVVEEGETWSDKIRRVWERLKAKTSIGIGLLIIWLAYQLKKWEIGIGDYFTKVLPKEIAGWWWIMILLAIAFFWAVYIANKWKDEPETIKKKPEEQKAEARKLIAFLIMLILGSVLLGLTLQLYAVNFHGINLTKSLFFLFIAIGVANLILQPGTGSALIKTFIFCSCLVIGVSIYGIYKGWQPLPKEAKVVASIKDQSCQVELGVPMRRIEEITKTLQETEIPIEERRELIKELEEAEKECRDIRNFYKIQEEKKAQEYPLVKLLKEQKYKVLLEDLHGKMWQAEITHRFVTSNRLILQVFQCEKLIFSGTLKEEKDGYVWQGAWKKISVGVYNWGLRDWGGFRVKFDKGCAYGEGSWTHQGKKKRYYLQFKAA